MLFKLNILRNISFKSKLTCELLPLFPRNIFTQEKCPGRISIFTLCFSSNFSPQHVNKFIQSHHCHVNSHCLLPYFHKLEIREISCRKSRRRLLLQWKEIRINFILLHEIYANVMCAVESLKLEKTSKAFTQEAFCEGF